MRLGRYCTGLNQGGQLADVVLGELGRRPLGVGPRPRSVDSPGNDLAARFGRDGAHAEWFYGFRLAVRTDLGRRLVRAWSIVPAAAGERQVGTDLIAGNAASIDALLLGNGFTGTRFAAEMASGGIELIIPPTGKQRTTMAKTLQRLIARLRNRAETRSRRSPTRWTSPATCSPSSPTRHEQELQLT
jgi:hypothetical protein